MRVLIVSDGYPQNPTSINGIFPLDQAKALQHLNVDVILASVDLRSVRRRRKLGLYWDEKDGIKIINYSFPLGRFPLKVLSYVGKKVLLRIYKEVINKYGEPDLAHAHFLVIGNIATILKEKFNLPLIITEHSSAINKNKLPEKIIKLGNETYFKIDFLISVSSRLASRIKYFWDIDSIVIPNIVDTNIFKYHKRKICDKDTFTFLSVGRIDFNKGFDILIPAFKKADFGTKVSLKIVGKGEYEEELLEIIKREELTEQIELIGSLNRKEIADLMKECDAFVLASRSETFGVVYIEALAAGLPVIATKCGGPEDFIDYFNGILVPIDDVDSLSKALLQMYDNVDNFDKKKISNDCKNRFAPLAVASQLYDVYTNVLHSNRNK